MLTDSPPKRNLKAFADSDQRNLAPLPPDRRLLASAELQGYLFSDTTTGSVISPAKDRGAHGYLAEDSSMQAIFIASGAATKKRSPAHTSFQCRRSADDRRTPGTGYEKHKCHVIREIIEAPGVH
jgi:hypothetical protein